MSFNDKIKNFIISCENDNFINITDPYNIAHSEGRELNIGDFVYFLGVFHFNSKRKLIIKCPSNKTFKVKVSYKIKGSFYKFKTSEEYCSYFKGIWGSNQVDLIDIESSFEIASLLKDFSSNEQVNNTKANENKISTDTIEQSSVDILNVNEESKSTLDKLLEHQYWNTELAGENEDLSKRLFYLQNTNKDLKNQVDTLSKQVETLTTDRDNLSNQVVSLQDKLNDARNLTEDNLNLSKQVETLTIDRDNLSNQVKTLQSKLVDLADKLNKSRKQALEQHNQVLKQENSNKDIIERYNNLFDTYNHLRKDYFALQENCKVLKTQNTSKNQVIEFLLGIVGILFLILMSF